MKFTRIARCFDLKEPDIDKAVSSRTHALALLEHLASVSSPNTGSAKVVLLLARMATTACDWIEGDLCVDLVQRGADTVVDATMDLGAGMRERVFPLLTLHAPLTEIARAMDEEPRIVAPLSVRKKTADRILLRATQAVRTSTMPPPISIARDSLFEMRAVRIPAATRAPTPPPKRVSKPRMTPRPEDVDAGWDDVAPAAPARKSAPPRKRSSKSFAVVENTLAEVRRDLARAPKGEEAAEIRHKALEYERTARTWRNAPPTAAERESLMKAVLKLHVAARKLAG